MQEFQQGEGLRTKDGLGKIPVADVALAAKLEQASNEKGCEHGHSTACDQRYQAAGPA